MNERIRELSQVADRLADDELAHLERVHNRLYSFTEGREILMEKFAELLVRECANVAAEQSAFKPEYRIRKHFGVEE